MANYQLNNLGYAFLNKDARLQEIVVPPSIDSIDKIDNYAFFGSSLTSIVFLGLSSAKASQIQDAQVFGIDHDCKVTTSDSKRFSWSQATKRLISDSTYTQLGTAKIQIGHPNKMALGKKIYKFQQDLYEWCTTPELQDTKKYLHPATCPMIIMYGDFKTSTRSLKFLHGILEDQSLHQWLGANARCYVFLVDRNGDQVCGSSSDLDYNFYKSLRPANAARDFVVVDFIYKSKYISKTFSSGDLLAFQTLVMDGMTEAGFNQFAWEDFDVALLEDPYLEVIPTTQPSVWKSPWWWNGSSAQTLPDWVVA